MTQRAQSFYTEKLLKWINCLLQFHCAIQRVSLNHFSNSAICVHFPLLYNPIHVVLIVIV